MTGFTLSNVGKEALPQLLSFFGAYSTSGAYPGQSKQASSSFFMPASYYAAPANPSQVQAPQVPNIRAFLPSDLGFKGFNTRNNNPRNKGMASTMLGGSDGGSLMTQRPTLLPKGY